MSQKDDFDSGSEVNQEQTDGKHPFLHETIKNERIGRKSFKYQVLRVILYGIIFGAFACFSFFAVRPWVEGFFYEEEERPVVTIIPEEPEEPEEPDEPEEDDTEEDPDEEDYNDIQPDEIVLPELTAENYQEMLDDLRNIAVGANRSIVYIRGVSGDDADWYWIDDDFGFSRITGLVVYDTEEEFLIVASNEIANSYDAFVITISDNTSHVGELVIQDNNRNLAVYSIQRNALEESNIEAMEPVAWGNSNTVRQGDLVIGIGNMSGHDAGLAYGTVSSMRRHITIPDSRIRILGTSITVSGRGTGFLFNRNGEVIGFLMPGPWADTGQGQGNALGVSDLKREIEMMLNGEPVPFVGILGTTVTEGISEAHGIPTGIHVNSMDVDSPAMIAGIQNGDVIISLDDEYVDNITAFNRTIIGLTVGSEINVVVMRRGAEGYVEMEFTIVVESRE